MRHILATMMKSILFFAILGCGLVYVCSECIDSVGNTVAEGGGPYIGDDHCNSCLCRQGMSICTKMFCMPGHYRCMGPDHRIYREGQRFKSADGCNTCACSENGGVFCTEMACVQLKETTTATTTLK